jgi:hypothetical protein
MISQQEEERLHVLARGVEMQVQVTAAKIKLEDGYGCSTFANDEIGSKTAVAVLESLRRARGLTP